MEYPPENKVERGFIYPSRFDWVMKSRKIQLVNIIFSHPLRLAVKDIVSPLFSQRWRKQKDSLMKDYENKPFSWERAQMNLAQ